MVGLPSWRARTAMYFWTLGTSSTGICGGGGGGGRERVVEAETAAACAC
jgi:hypothetical protein